QARARVRRSHRGRRRRDGRRRHQDALHPPPRARRREALESAMAIENDELKRGVGGKVAGVQEEVIERALRPRGLAEYVGQEKIREQLSIFIAAARKRSAEQRS